MSISISSAKNWASSRLPPRAKITLKRARAYQTLRHWHRLLKHPSYRTDDRAALAQFEAFCRDNATAMRQDVLPRERKPKLALLVRAHALRYAGIQALVMKSLQLAGFETLAIGRREYDVLRYDWLVGNRAGYTFDDFGSESDPAWIEEQLPQLRSLRAWLGLQYQGVAVGRIVLSTVLRGLKIGRLDYEDPETREKLRATLEACIRDTKSASTMLDAIHPDCVVFIDRGYSGQGELFDLAVNRGIEAFTWDVGYKGSRLIFKRYSARNRREHPLAPSKDSWNRIRSMPWKPEYGAAVRKELFDCYENQDWFAAVATQVGKQILSREKTREQLQLTPGRKVAVIFPHILWDGSFFFGEDLFDDYAEWLAETLKAACANDRLDWVVKLHPSHVFKARAEHDSAKPAEMQLIDKLFESIPPHVKLVYPDTNISTYSLFEIADYTVTVRGTVGIESALFGVPTLTAGTGRYADRGFTLDSATREQYLHRLATLETQPGLSAEQKELAERYAYAIFLCRPLALSSASFRFDHDAGATLKLTVNCRTREDWLAAPDFQRLARWLVDGEQEDLLLLPDQG